MPSLKHFDLHQYVAFTSRICIKNSHTDENRKTVNTLSPAFSIHSHILRYLLIPWKKELTFRTTENRKKRKNFFFFFFLENEMFPLIVELLCKFFVYAACQLDSFWHNRLLSSKTPARQVSLASLQSTHSYTLEAQICFEVLSNWKESL